MDFLLRPRTGVSQTEPLSLTAQGKGKPPEACEEGSAPKHAACEAATELWQLRRGHRNTV